MSSGTQRSSTHPVAHTVTSEDVVQGQILFLPPFHETPENSVRRVFGKGPVDEGIFDHPVVICSRPADEEDVVHFCMVTSFRGKKLNEIYGKTNKFHKERRSRYLPVSPTPPHPDATTKAGKNFPSLKLQDGAYLRWESYVNVHGVYKIYWSHLRPYSNVKTPLRLQYRLDKESLNRLLIRSKNLTSYVPGSQFEPGSAGISLRISNPAISSGNPQPARPTKPAIVVRPLGAADYGSIRVPASHNEQSDDQGYCSDGYILAIRSRFMSLVIWIGDALKYVWKRSREACWIVGCASCC